MERGLPYPELPATVDLPALEWEVLARWRQGKVFQRSLEQTAGGPQWIFYEGPPTANGMPGIHHVPARAIKDLFPRFKTMQGFHVPRRGGWDCQGLHVEVAVEKELGLSGKRDIEAYGIAEFNARCRESVLRHVDAFERLTERMGHWIDLSAAYRTMDSGYIESVWWALKQIFDKGLLVRDFRISPYCPRCGTALSDHELGQPDAYQTVTDLSATVRLRLLSLPGPTQHAHPRLDGADLLVWTTTPWTLVSNTAVAVHPDETYVLARKSGDSDQVVVADALFARVLGEGWYIVERFRGAELSGATYRPPFDLIEIPSAHRVVTGDFVTTGDGTGLVHLAPAFGAEDMAAGRAHGLPVVNPVQPDGRFEENLPLVGGMFFTDANRRLVASLADRGLLFRSQPHEHSYPHCWRCGTALLYYALPTWFIRTTVIKDQLLAANDTVNWQPPTIKYGRFGEWLRNNVDWALSRTRYWGTPLPLWLCSNDHVTCVGSLAELSGLAGRDLTALDPHRPFVDEITFDCPRCATPASRVPEVIDAWFDSGSMPFAQHGAPPQGQQAFAKQFPAQFIAEGLDQTRGWFYSLLAVSTMLFGQSPYQNALCLGLVADEHGRKMSKHLGNVIEPLPLMEQHGADAVRWFFTGAGSPWAAQRVSQAALEEIVRKVLLTYWNTVSFYVLYANAASRQGDFFTSERAGAAIPAADRRVLDRWLVSESHRLIRDVTAALEAFDSGTAGRRIADFIADLSNWYVRRSRRRFWEGPGSRDGASAFATLHDCLTILTRLMAPFMPFITDYVWNVLREDSDPESVHLVSWPQADPVLIDEQLAAQMALARRLVEQGRSARASAVVRLRQPLSRALVGAPGFAGLPKELRREIAEELNVGQLAPLGALDGELIDFSVKPNFRALGSRFGNATPTVAAAIGMADPADLVAQLGRTGAASLVVDGTPVRLAADELVVTQTPRAGWVVSSDGGETVALEVTITPELRREGLAREVVRLIQDARKSDGLAVTDRISLRWATPDQELAAALTEHRELIGSEVLATDFGPASGPEEPAPPGPAIEHSYADLGLTFWIRRIS